MDHKQAVRLSVAVSEIITDIVLFAFGPKLGEFEFSFNSQDDRIEIIIHEFGEPFDPERHQYNKEDAIAHGKFDGAGFKLVRHLVDDFLFLNKGKDGIEFRMVQRKSHEHISTIFDAKELKKVKKPPQDPTYHVSRVGGEDAEDVSKLIYRTYGHSYYKDSMYYPKKVELALDQKEKFAVICRTQYDLPVGYFAVLFTTDSNIGEVGEAVVAVNHRRRGIMKNMLNELVRISREKGLLGLFGEANAAHSFSQRANARFGFQTTAINMAMAPPFEIAGVDPKTANQPVTGVFEFVPLVTEKEVEGYVPPQYENILHDTHELLGTELISLELPDQVFQEKTDLEIKIHYSSLFAIIVVKKYGPYFFDYLLQTVKDLKEQGMNAVFLDMPIKLPETKLVVEDLQKLNFLYGGLVPKFHKEEDYFRMQRIFCDMDMNLIKTYSPMSHRIKGLLVKEME